MPSDERTTTIDGLAAEIGSGLASRLRSLVIALDRLDRLESGSGAWLDGFQNDELPASAAEMVLRALRTSADPTNFAILRCLAETGSSPLRLLIETTQVGRLTISERLNDLVQVGLATRLIDTDQAQITSAGLAAVRLIETITGEVIRQFRPNLRI